MRYENKAGVGYHIAQPFQSLPMDQPELLSQNDVEASVFYPRFSRVTQGHHKDPGIYASGYADNMLVEHPALVPKGHSVINEGKTPWTYPTDQLEDILKGAASILSPDGIFQKGSDHNRHGGNVLLKQVRAGSTY